MYIHTHREEQKKLPLKQGHLLSLWKFWPYRDLQINRAVHRHCIWWLNNIKVTTLSGTARRATQSTIQLDGSVIHHWTGNADWCVYLWNMLAGDLLIENHPLCGYAYAAQSTMNLFWGRQTKWTAVGTSQHKPVHNYTVMEKWLAPMADNLNGKFRGVLISGIAI